MHRNNYNPIKTKPEIDLTSFCKWKDLSEESLSMFLAIYFGFENIMNIFSYMKDVKNLLTLPG